MTPIKTQTFILPRLLRLFAVTVLIVCGIGYAAWQGRHLLLGPELTVTNEPEVVQTGRVIFISGIADNVTALSLNGRPIVTDQAGNFTEGVVLENGYSMVSLDARDRFGREVHWEKPVVFVEEAAVATRNNMEVNTGL